MWFLAVDDERLMGNELVSALHSARPETEVLPFRWLEDALKAAKKPLCCGTGMTTCRHTAE